MTIAPGALQELSRGPYDPDMPRRPSSERFVVGDLVPRADERAGWVAINHSSAMPSRFTIDAQLKEPPCTVWIDAVVDSSGEIRVKSLHVDVPLPGPASISTTSLRSVLISQLVRGAVQRLAQPIEVLPDVHRGAFHVAGTPEAEVWIGTPTREGRGRETPRDRIRAAATHYRDAVAQGSRSPVKDVARRLNFSESQTSRYLKAARLEGMLDDVPAPTPGRRMATVQAEQEPGPVPVSEEVRQRFNEIMFPTTRAVTEEEFRAEEEGLARNADLIAKLDDERRAQQEGGDDAE